MAQRAYGQACPLARALDAVGERWTLLIVRDLLLGAARFGELVERLPGIGTNLLSDRLKSLEKLGVARRLSGSGRSGWELTSRGRALEPALVELIRWAMRNRLPVHGGETSRPEWDFVAMKALFDPTLAGSLSGEFNVVLNGMSASMAVRDGRLELSRRDPVSSRARVEMDSATGWQLATGALELDEALDSGRVVITGDSESGRRLLGSFRLRCVAG